MVSASIVIYKHSFEELSNLIHELCDSVIDRIYIVNNFDDNLILKNLNSNKIHYIQLPNNIGFGSGHNVAFREAIDCSFDYHFVINPDISLTKESVNILIGYIRRDETIGLLMPQILNFDGTIQYLPKLLPSPFNFFLKKLPIVNSF
jgi:GT2 family glycosyltransferase